MCRMCGWTFQTPVYDDAELERLYISKSEKERHCRSDRSILDEVKKRGEHIFSLTYPRLNTQMSTVLDVGGGNGELMGTFVDRGLQVTVLDLSGGSPYYAGISKIKSSFLDWNTGIYDIIILSHVLEHASSPSTFLSHAKNLLADGGILFIEVPFELLTPFVSRGVGDHRHLSYFTSTTLRNYLERSGLQCICCFHTSDIIGGNTIPLIRALATKDPYCSQKTCSKHSRIIFLKSLTELLRPEPWVYRIRNKLSRGFGILS